MRPTALVKHRIKRVWRFLKNDRIDLEAAQHDLIHAIFRPLGGKLVCIAVDWVDIRSYKVLVAAVVVRGRSIPLLWAAYEKWQLYKSQNNLEEGFFRLLKTLIPGWCRVVVVADRGFGRTSVATEMTAIGLPYVIRIQPSVWVKSGEYEGRLDDMPVRRGVSLWLGKVLYRKVRPVEQYVSMVWRARYEEPWFLMSNTAWRAERLFKIYAARMRVEELFRDKKNIANGWGLRWLRLSAAERLERLLLVLAVAYLWLVLAGLWCKRKLPRASYSVSSREGEMSLFRIGRELIGKIKIPLKLLLAQIPKLVKTNWG
jgi:hypothetical protein